MIVNIRLAEKRYGEEEQLSKVNVVEFEQLVEKYKNNPDKYEYVKAHEYPLFQNKEVDVIKDGIFVFKGKTKDRKYMVSFSGGKDSTAMLIRLLELGAPVDGIIFADTQYELPIMYEYIDRVERYIQNNFSKELRIQKVTTTKKLEDMVMGTVTRGVSKGKQRGFPLTAFPCYWSRESKIRPLDAVMKGHYRYIGIAVDEKRRASKNAKESLFIYPLIEWGWTEQDCIDYLDKLGLTNPIYNDNISRTGCFWCPKQKKDSLYNLYAEHPEQWKEMKEMERKAGRSIRYDITVEELEQEFKERLAQELKTKKGVE